MGWEGRSRARGRVGESSPLVLLRVPPAPTPCVSEEVASPAGQTQQLTLEMSSLHPNRDMLQVPQRVEASSAYFNT